MIKIFQIILVLMIFQDFIQVNIPFFSYLDEGLVIISTMYVLLLLMNKKKSIKINRYELISFILLISYLFLGIVSNIFSNIIGLKYAFLSMIMTMKGYILYFNTRIILQYYNVSIDLLKFISEVLKWTVYIFTIIGLINIPLNFLKDYGIRFGINTIAIGFSHPTELAFFAVISMTVILLYYNYTNKSKGELKIIIACSLLIIFTGRSKAIAFICVYILLFYLMKIVKSFKLKYFIIFTPIMMYIALPRIISELFNGARGYLYSTGYIIAKDYFPIGSGFGTFGSHISRIFYSPLYFRYGISDVWGLSPSMPSYISDTYWAMIMGETGFIGVLLIVLILYFIFIQFIKIYTDYKNKFIVFGLISYTVITSIAEPIYSSNKSAAFFMVLATFITIQKNSLSKKEKELA